MNILAATVFQMWGFFLMLELINAHISWIEVSVSPHIVQMGRRFGFIAGLKVKFMCKRVSGSPC